MSNKYDWGIYTGIGGVYDYRDKEANIQSIIRHMMNKTLIMFKYEGLPDTIPAIELEKILQTYGKGVFTEVDGELYVMNGNPSGYPDAYGRPRKMLVNNVGLNFNEELEIGEECLVMKNDRMGTGLMPLLTKYSTMLVENDITMIRASINKRLDIFFSVKDDMTGESARVFLKKLEDGDLGYILENKLFDSFKAHDTSTQAGANLNELFQYHQYLKGSMMNEVGLNTAFNMKKERLITSEIEETTDGLYPLIDNMLDCRLEALEEINEMYGTNITVELYSSWGLRKKKEQIMLNELDQEFMDEATEDIDTIPESEEQEQEQEQEQQLSTLEELGLIDTLEDDEQEEDDTLEDNKEDNEDDEQEEDEQEEEDEDVEDKTSSGEDEEDKKGD